MFLSINLMFKEVNNEIKKGNIHNSLILIRDIWLKFPKNTKLFEEINQPKKKHSIKLNTSLDQNLIENFFALHENGKTFLVIKKLEDIFDKNNNDFYVLNLLGTFNGLMKNYKEATKFQKLSIALNPFDANNYLNLSHTFKMTNKNELALTYIEIAKLLDFKNITINKLLAEQYYKLNKIESSIKIYEYLIELDNNDIKIKLDYIKSLIKNDKTDKSLKLLETISFDRTFQDKILTLKGLAYFKIKNFEKAKKLIEQSLTENPKNSDAFLIFGLIHENYGFIDKAIESYLNAINFNKKNFIALFKDKHPNVQFFGADENVDENIYDQHIPFGHIGGYLRLSKKEFSNSIFPYISSNKTTKDSVVRKYKNSGKLLVGLSWSSSNNLLTKNKSLSLEVLLPVLKINNIKFIDLEYQNSFDEVNHFYKKYGIKIFKEHSIDNFNDIEGLTSIIDACDFVISCSNTNAHLSGALFKKTYLLLAKGKGRLWNWNEFKGKSIWYPNTKIFEQTVVGNWTHPVQSLKKEILTNEIKTK